MASKQIYFARLKQRVGVEWRSGFSLSFRCADAGSSTPDMNKPLKKGGDKPARNQKQ